MKRFIILHQDFNSDTTTPYYLDPSAIVGFRKSRLNNSTYIILLNGNTINVVETVGEIIDLLNKSYAELEIDSL